MKPNRVNVPVVATLDMSQVADVFDAFAEALRNAAAGYAAAADRLRSRTPAEPENGAS